MEIKRFGNKPFYAPSLIFIITIVTTVYTVQNVILMGKRCVTDIYIG